MTDNGLTKAGDPRKREARPNEGRPSAYDPVYCTKIIEAGREGFSLTAFAGIIGVCRDTINEWGRKHPEFSDAIRRHSGARTYKLESDLLSAKEGPVVTSRIFALKNAAPDEWREKQEHAHSGPNGGPIQTESRVVVNITATQPGDYFAPDGSLVKGGKDSEQGGPDPRAKA